MENKLRVTAHALLRMSQRNISLSDVLIALKHGRRIHRSHADFWFLGWRDCPRGLERLEGLTVVVEGTRFLSTVYKNKRAISMLRRKPKRNNGYREHAQPMHQSTKPLVAGVR